MDLPTSQDDKQTLLDALKTISASMSRMDAERDLIRAAKKEVCDQLQLPVKVLNKLAKTYHKGNYSEETEQHKHFVELYETVAL